MKYLIAIEILGTIFGYFYAKKTVPEMMHSSALYNIIVCALSWPLMLLCAVVDAMAVDEEDL